MSEATNHRPPTPNYIQQQPISKKILSAVLATANDISTYLGDESVPLECYPKDIDCKLQDLYTEIQTLLNTHE